MRARAAGRRGSSARVGAGRAPRARVVGARVATAASATAACALFDADGRLLARSRALWIELQAGVGCPPWPPTTAPARSAKPPAASRSRPRDARWWRSAATSRTCFSHGFICPKATGLKQLHEDPDRLSTPLVRRDGELRRGELGRGLRGDRPAPLPDPRRARPQRGGRLHRQPQRPQPVRARSTGRCWLRALGTQNIYTASTVDQMPKHVSAGLMFGAVLSIPVPDVDRTDHLLILGANPLVSNGSLLTAPDMRGRLRAHPRARRQGRGGRPAPHPHRRGGRRAPLHPARAATRYLLLGDGLHALRGGPGRPGRLAEHLNGLERGDARWRASFTPEQVAGRLRHRGRRRSGAWPASWPPPRAPRCTAASAPARRSSGRWPAGWWTW